MESAQVEPEPQGLWAATGRTINPQIPQHVRPLI